MIEVRDRLDKAAWNDVLARLPVESRDVYFTPEFYDLQVADGKGETNCKCLSEGDKLLLVPGLQLPVPTELLRAGVHSYWDLQSAMGFGSIVASPSVDRAFIQAAWTLWCEQSAAQGIVAAFFRLHPLLDESNWLPTESRVRAFRKTAYADLTRGLEAAWGDADYSHRKQVNKGKRAGLRIDWDDPRAWDQLEPFYISTMQRIGAWVEAFYSHEYFTLLRNLPGARLASVSEGERLLACSVFLFGPCWGHYHIAARDLNAAPYLHNCILQSALELAAQMGLRGLHLGGGTTRAPDDSHLRFKQNVGSQLRDYRIALVIANAPVYAELRDSWVRRSGQQPDWLMEYRQPLPRGFVAPMV